VRGEGIAGTLSSSDDTPATSDSDAKSKSKRKRDGGADPVASKKSKKDKKDKKDKKKDKKAVSETDAVAKKLAKLSVDEKKSYEERAQAKGQSLEEYVRRRIQKKDEQRAARYVSVVSG
jgi:nucleolar protein TMA23